MGKSPIDIQYVLHLTHPTHSNYYIHTTKESADFAVAEYVSDMWSELMDGEIPASSDEAIRDFYLAVEGEAWKIAAAPVLDLVS